MNLYDELSALQLKLTKFILSLFIIVSHLIQPSNQAHLMAQIRHVNWYKKKYIIKRHMTVTLLSRNTMNTLGLSTSSLEKCEETRYS